MKARVECEVEKEARGVARCASLLHVPLEPRPTRHLTRSRAQGAPNQHFASAHVERHLPQGGVQVDGTPQHSSWHQEAGSDGTGIIQ
jgi:hypothetical protein